MGKFDQPSRCSSETPVKFRWYGYPTAIIGNDIPAALDKFISVITASPRIANSYVVINAQREFLHYMTLARQGKLIPVDDVKPVDIENPPPLYEIRWKGITVQEMAQTGQIKSKTLMVRLYHSEPVKVPNYFIGHHIHEKVIGTDEYTRTDQNAEIRVARGFYDAGFSTSWGLPVA